MSEYTCPHCKQPISDDDALLCHYCGESLNRGSHGALGRLRYDSPPVVWVIGVLLVIVAVFFLFSL